MSSDEIVTALVSAWGSSLMVTAAMLWCMHRLQWLVQPSARSAHAVPKPSGGGVGVIAGFAIGHLVTGVSLSIYWWSAIGIIMLVVMDDVRKPFSVFKKTLFMLVAIVVLLADPRWIELFSGSSFFSGNNVFLFCLAVFWFFSLCNVFNFMDGIDGIGATQSIIIASFLSFHIANYNSLLALQAWIFIASLLAFLVFNRPPARIFMGDVGSHFCGFFVAAFSIFSVANNVSGIHVLALLSYYFSDTTYTLVRRLLNRENIFQAHNKHVYQRLARMGWSHSKVSIWAGSMTVLNGVGGYLLTSGLSVLGGFCWFISASIWISSILHVECKGPSFAYSS